MHTQKRKKYKNDYLIESTVKKCSKARTYTNIDYKGESNKIQKYRRQIE